MAPKWYHDSVRVDVVEVELVFTRHSFWPLCRLSNSRVRPRRLLCCLLRPHAALGRSCGRTQPSAAARDMPAQLTFRIQRMASAEQCTSCITMALMLETRLGVGWTRGSIVILHMLGLRAGLVYMGSLMVVRTHMLRPGAAAHLSFLAAGNRSPSALPAEAASTPKRAAQRLEGIGRGKQQAGARN
jgi:hypothetical protein